MHFIWKVTWTSWEDGLVLPEIFSCTSHQIKRLMIMIILIHYKDDCTSQNKSVVLPSVDLVCISLGIYATTCIDCPNVNTCTSHRCAFKLLFFSKFLKECVFRGVLYNMHLIWKTTWTYRDGSLVLLEIFSCTSREIKKKSRMILLIHYMEDYVLPKTNLLYFPMLTFILPQV
jgi:hypothetical protein